MVTDYKYIHDLSDIPSSELFDGNDVFPDIDY